MCKLVTIIEVEEEVSRGPIVVIVVIDRRERRPRKTTDREREALTEAGDRRPSVRREWIRGKRASAGRRVSKSACASTAACDAAMRSHACCTR